MVLSFRTPLRHKSPTILPRSPLSSRLPPEKLQRHLSAINSSWLWLNQPSFRPVRVRTATSRDLCRTAGFVLFDIKPLCVELSHTFVSPWSLEWQVQSTAVPNRVDCSVQVEFGPLFCVIANWIYCFVPFVVEWNFSFGITIFLRYLCSRFFVPLEYDCGYC